MPGAGTQAGFVLHAANVPEFLVTRPDVGWIEVHAESIMQEPGLVRALVALRPDYGISLHSVGLSLGSAEGVDPVHLRRLAELHDALEPHLVSDHLSWSTSGGIFLNALLPIPRTREALDVACRNIDAVQATLGRAISVENVSAYLRYRDNDMPEGAFMAEVARRAGCGILLDVNNLFVNGINLGDDSSEILQSLPRSCVSQYHLGGHAKVSCGDGWVLLDEHGGPVDPAVWDLFGEAVDLFGPRPTLIEWDADPPPLRVLVDEARRADAILVARPDNGDLP